MASINPLGERARGNRWWRTAAAFTAGCLLGGWALGLVGAAVGAVVAQAAMVPPGVVGWIAVALAMGTGVVELAGWRVPTARRQVDEAWLNRYRGWVYGTGFGVQLGAGLATTVTTFGVYSTVALVTVIGAGGHPVAAQAVGTAFGLARAAPVLTGRTLRDPARLRQRAAWAAGAATSSRRVAGASLCALALTAAAVG